MDNSGEVRSLPPPLRDARPAARSCGDRLASAAPARNARAAQRRPRSGRARADGEPAAGGAPAGPAGERSGGA